MNDFFSMSPDEQFWLHIFKSFVVMVDTPVVIWFVWAWIIDIITGTAKAAFPKANVKLDSSVGLKGLVKHAEMLLIVVTLFPFLDVINLEIVGIFLASFYAVQYSLSIVENLSVMGIPFPKVVTNRLEKFKDTLNEADPFDENKK